jgi:hypothetical protein
MFRTSFGYDASLCVRGGTVHYELGRGESTLALVAACVQNSLPSRALLAPPARHLPPSTHRKCLASEPTFSDQDTEGSKLTGCIS